MLENQVFGRSGGGRRSLIPVAFSPSAETEGNRYNAVGAPAPPPSNRKYQSCGYPASGNGLLLRLPVLPTDL